MTWSKILIGHLFDNFGKERRIVNMRGFKKSGEIGFQLKGRNDMVRNPDMRRLITDFLKIQARNAGS